MKRVLATLMVCVGVFCASHDSYAAARDVLIQEVFSNPEGSDTGFEYIVIKNTGSDVVALDGWTLYPDGVGYYVFPSFSLPAGADVTVRIRVSGTDSVDTLYHASATGNMGNTSGSIALFSSATRNEETMADFMQYGKVGETWESTAKKAALWDEGGFVPVDSTQENYILRRNTLLHDADAWEFVPYIAAESPSSNVDQAAEGGGDSPASGSVYSGPTVQEKIRAYAGHDVSGVAGAEFQFGGKTLGFEDDVIADSNLRYLWNFGDGVVQEGKKVSHTYRYPGTYIATLTVIQLEESFSDYIKVVVRENPLTISDVDAGAGWVQISNPSAYRVDISNWSLYAGDSLLFRLPAGTLIAEHARVVFATTSFVEAPILLRYPNGQDAAAEILKPPPTPIVRQARIVAAPPIQPSASEEVKKVEVEESIPAPVAPVLETAALPHAQASLGKTGVSPMIMLLLSIGGGLFAGFIVVAARMYWRRSAA